MGKDTKIQWCHHTWNRWRGCRKVAPECENCYIVHTPPLRMIGQVHGSQRVSAGDSYIKEPLQWNAAAAKAKERRRVFVMSLGDWLDMENVPLRWWVDIIDMIRLCPWLDFLLLTKRPQNFNKRMLEFAKSEELNELASEAAAFAMAWEQGTSIPFNAWVGVSAGVDVSPCLDIPAAVHFLSCEPMIKPLATMHAKWFDWIIFGGESGPGARNMNMDWLETGVSFCRAQRIPYFVKQLGESPITNNPLRRRQLARMKDKKRGDWDEWIDTTLAGFRVRDFPRVKVPPQFDPLPF